MERKLKKGSKVWVKDPEEAWVEGIILGRYKPSSAREEAVLAASKGARNSEGVPSPYRIVVQLGKELKRRGGKTRVVDARLECEVRRSKSAKVYSHVEDLTSIDTLHEPGLLEALEQRYAQDRIYTFTGRILLAVNPFKPIPGLYGKDMVRKYASATADADLPAHIYKVAGTAYKDVMERGGLNQTVLVSGESGAGKTETTKIIMRSLAAMSQWRSSGASGTDISERVLRSNPVLETFGNSCTIRNENSSRFGKLIEMKFDPESGSTLGAHITTYLLEKARLTKQFPGERNFHVFYEMAAGGSDEQLERWRIPGSLFPFNFISQKADMERVEESDADNFRNTVAAMHELGMTTEEINEVFDIVAGVLHLGNLAFEAVGHEQACRIRFDDDTMLSCEACCDLLKVDADALEFALCKRVIRVRGTDQELAERGNLPAHLRREDEHFEKSLTVEEAALARDALAMTVYERIFGWLVWRLNQCIQTEPIRASKRAGQRARMSKRAMEAELKVEIDDHVYNTQYKIGLLDVFGFEVFERNGFAQLCINYCNETLQHLFNESVFRRDQLEYDEEGIDWTFIRYPDNAACIEMFESKPIGLFTLMDENCMYPGGNDNTMVTKMWSHLPDRFPRFLHPTREDKADFTFRVRHYAGDVVYSAEGFFAQNKNELRQEAVDLVSASRSPILKELLPPEAKDAAGGADIASFFDNKLGSNFSGQSSANGVGARAGRDLQRAGSNGQTSPTPGVLQQTTVGSHFQAQLRVAVEKIRASSAHYVRCLKPNDENVPDFLDRRRLVEQLRYSGVLQIIQVTRAGYPYRFTFAEFLIRYAVLGKRGTPYKAQRLAEKANQETQKRNCLKIANNAQLVHGEEYQLGKSKVFLRQLSFIILEVLKDERVAQIAGVVQRAARKFLALKRKGHVFKYKPRARTKKQAASRVPDAEPVLAHEEGPQHANGGKSSLAARRKKAPIEPRSARARPAHDFEDMIQEDDDDWEIDLDAADPVPADPKENGVGAVEEAAPRARRASKSTAPRSEAASVVSRRRQSSASAISEDAEQPPRRRQSSASAISEDAEQPPRRRQSSASAISEDAEQPPQAPLQTRRSKANGRNVSRETRQGEARSSPRSPPSREKTQHHDDERSSALRKPASRVSAASSRSRAANEDDHYEDDEAEVEETQVPMPTQKRGLKARPSPAASASRRGGRSPPVESSGDEDGDEVEVYDDDDDVEDEDEETEVVERALSVRRASSKRSPESAMARQVVQSAAQNGAAPRRARNSIASSRSGASRSGGEPLSNGRGVKSTGRNGAVNSKSPPAESVPQRRGRARERQYIVEEADEDLSQSGVEDDFVSEVDDDDDDEEEAAENARIQNRIARARAARASSIEEALDEEQPRGRRLYTPVHLDNSESEVNDDNEEDEEEEVEEETQVPPRGRHVRSVAQAKGRSLNEERTARIAAFRQQQQRHAPPQDADDGQSASASDGAYEEEDVEEEDTFTVQRGKPRAAVAAAASAGSRRTTASTSSRASDGRRKVVVTRVRGTGRGRKDVDEVEDDLEDDDAQVTASRGRSGRRRY